MSRNRQPLRLASFERYKAHNHSYRGSVMPELLGFLAFLIQTYIWIILAVVIMSWLMSFGVVNAYNPMVRSIWQALNAVTEPVIRPIRDRLPNMGGIDISPMILIFVLIGLKDFLFPFLLRSLA
jgi:YggT family protein